MKKIDTQLLRKLVNAFAISGDEDEVRKIIRKEVKPHVDSIKVDRMGNLICLKKGKKGAPKIMLAAHMDEIGVMVKRIEQKGFVYMTSIGGIEPLMLLGTQLLIETKKGVLHGSVTTREISAGKYLDRLPSIESLFIDTGLNKQQLEKLGVKIGTYIRPACETCCFDNFGLVLGKALDDRIGCLILIELAKLLKRSPNEIYFVFTVQEEIGLYGAKTSAFEIHPDWGIVIDTTHANEPFAEPSRFIGRGPCLTMKDGEFISNRHIANAITAAAKRKKIPVQLEATELGTTDAAIIQTTRGGVPSAALTIPVRNIHTWTSIARMSDIENTIDILEELLKRPLKIKLV